MTENEARKAAEEIADMVLSCSGVHIAAPLIRKGGSQIILAAQSEPPASLRGAVRQVIKKIDTRHMFNQKKVHGAILAAVGSVVEAREDMIGQLIQTLEAVIRVTDEPSESHVYAWLRSCKKELINIVTEARALIGGGNDER